VTKRELEITGVIAAKPGITIPEIAEAIGVKQNLLYRVLPSLVRDGHLKKAGRGWFPKDWAA
jgi:DNA-binding MarR family transcriptional regulator